MPCQKGFYGLSAENPCQKGFAGIYNCFQYNKNNVFYFPQLVHNLHNSTKSHKPVAPAVYKSVA